MSQITIYTCDLCEKKQVSDKGMLEVEASLRFYGSATNMPADFYRSGVKHQICLDCCLQLGVIKPGEKKVETPPDPFELLMDVLIPAIQERLNNESNQ